MILECEYNVWSGSLSHHQLWTVAVLHRHRAKSLVRKLEGRGGKRVVFGICKLIQNTYISFTYAQALKETETAQN